jgi:hypothetical protein
LKPSKKGSKFANFQNFQNLKPPKKGSNFETHKMAKFETLEKRVKICKPASGGPHSRTLPRARDWPPGTGQRGHTLACPWRLHERPSENFRFVIVFSSFFFIFRVFLFILINFGDFFSFFLLFYFDYFYLF